MLYGGRGHGADLGSCWEVPSGCLLAGDTVMQVWQFRRYVLQPSLPYPLGACPTAVPMDLWTLTSLGTGLQVLLLLAGSQWRCHGGGLLLAMTSSNRGAALHACWCMS